MANGFGSDEPTATTPAEALLAHRAAALDAAFGKADVAGRLAGIIAEANGRVVFTTSFGLEDQVLTHFIATAKLPVTMSAWRSRP